MDTLLCREELRDILNEPEVTYCVVSQLQSLTASLDNIADEHQASKEYPHRYQPRT